MTERRRLPNRRQCHRLGFIHAGLRYSATYSLFDDGELAEIFLEAGRPGDDIQTMARDAAVVLSIAFQYGAPAETIRAALTRLPDGSPAGPVGVLLENIGG